MASKKFLVDLDLNFNELQNAVFQNLASSPANPKEGQFYYNTASHSFMIWNGTSWIDSSAIYTFSTGLTETNGVVTLNEATTSALGGVIVGTNIDVANDGTISVKSASTTDLGLIEIADADEIAAGAATDKAVTPAQLKAGLDTKIGYTDLSATGPITYNNATGVISATYDNAPTDSSDNLVKSGAVKAALDDKVDANTAITGATKCKVTYDAKGLVTDGADLEASDIPDISDTYVLQTQLGAASVQGGATGVATLGTDGKVPTNQLPSYVDDVVDAYVVGSTPLAANWLSRTEGGAALTPETDKIYVVVGPSGSTYVNSTYRWSGTTYVNISTSYGQATESDLGVAMLATTAEVTAGTNDTKIVTPLKLAGRIGAYASENVTFTNKSIDADNNTVSNLETDNFKSGVVQTTVRAATSASDTALASEKAIATELAKKPEKLVVTNPALTPASGLCTWTITNTLASNDVICIVKEASSGEEVYCNVVYGDGSVTIKMNASATISAGTYKAVLIG